MPEFYMVEYPEVKLYQGGGIFRVFSVDLEVDWYRERERKTGMPLPSYTKEAMDHGYESIRSFLVGRGAPVWWPGVELPGLKMISWAEAEEIMKDAPAHRHEAYVQWLMNSGHLTRDEAENLAIEHGR